MATSLSFGRRMSVTLVTLVTGLTGIVPAASAQSEPIPYFRRLNTDTTQPLPANDPELGNEMKIGACLEADRNEAFAGDEVTYTLCIKNLYRGVMPEFRMAFFYDPNLMTIVESSGATFHGNNIAWRILPMQRGEVRKIRVRVRLPKNLRSGARLETYGSLVWDGNIQPACAKHVLTIISRPPVTGAGDNTSSVENVNQFLKPIKR